MPKFQDKPTVVTNDLSNTNAYFPMVQSGLNKKATIPQIKRDAVANCSTAAGTVAKTATIRNMPDFELLSGIVVTVAFSNTNTAESPTLNINNTGAWPIKLENQASNVTIGNGCWVAGAILEFKYVEVSDTEKYWLLVGYNVAQQTSEYTIMSDGRIEYPPSQLIIVEEFTKSNISSYINAKEYIEFGIEANTSKDGYRLIAQQLEVNGNHSTSFLIGTSKVYRNSYYFVVFNNYTSWGSIESAILKLTWAKN